MANDSGFTLTDAGYYGRQGVKFGLVLLVVLMVGRVVLTAAVSYYRAVHPPAPPPPTMGFGVLPSIVFPSQTAEQKPSAYQLELPTGRFPAFPDRAKVLLKVKTSPSLLADQRAKEVAANYGFVLEPTVLSSRIYRWTKSEPLQAALEMDTQNQHFSLRTDFLSRPELLAQRNLPTDAEAVEVAKTFLSTGVDLPQDMATASGKVSYLKALGGELAPAVSLSDADFLQVDLQRTPIDGQLPMYTPEGTKGIFSAVIAGSRSTREQVMRAEFRYQPVDYTQVHTYPLRSPAAAWQVLQSGEGYVAQKGSLPTAVVRDVYLGYFDNTEEEEYLQPIYIFAGDGGFLGYVTAVDPQLIQVGGSAAAAQ